MFLIEPILGDCTREGIFYAHHTLGKAEKWASREEANEFVKITSPFLTWDQRVLECWLTHGVVASASFETPAAVQLATSREEEASTYVRAVARTYDSDEHRFQEPPDFDETTDKGRDFYCPAATITMAMRIPEIRPPVLYLFGERSPMSPRVKQQALLQQTGSGIGGSGGGSPMVRSHVVAHSSHLLPFERPKACADSIVGALIDMAERPAMQPGSSASKSSPKRLSEAWTTMLDRGFSALKRPTAEKL